MTLSKRTQGSILKGAAVTLDVGGPLVATITQFPAWIERSSGSTMSGLFVVFALLSAIPMFKFFGKNLKSPSSVMLWAIGLGLLIALRTIVDEMIIICFVGVLSNTIGTGMYKIGEGLCKEEKKDE